MTVLVGKNAPDFSANAVVDNEIVNHFSLSQFRGKYLIFFFYPLDFTFVCPTELTAFQDKLEEFREKNAEVIGCSVDSVHAHHAWISTPRNKGGIEGVQYPIVSDIHKTIAKEFGVLAQNEGIAYRALFLIDKQGKVRHQLVNDLPLGRSVDEAMRILDALIFFEEHGNVCPANWNKGKPGMQATKNGLLEYVTAEISK